MFMLSDANLAMYGVSPTSLATALMSDPMVIISAPPPPSARCRRTNQPDHV